MAKPLKIDFVSDVSCPWCVIGLKSLERALGSLEGRVAADIERSRDNIRARGAELGFEFNMQRRGRIYNTFDAHRLLHWAELEGKPEALKKALFSAYFTAGLNPSDHAVLRDIAQKVGLDSERAAKILASDEFAAEVRAREKFYADRGIRAVPSVIINDKRLIQGGQPAEVFERALLQLASQ